MNTKTEVLKLLRHVENRHCADCSSLLDGRVYANIDIGVWICRECKDTHRSLLTDQRVVNKEILTDDDVMIMAKAGNNVRRNMFLERYIPSEGWIKPTSTSADAERQLWCLAKYDCGLFTFPFETKAKSSRDVLPARLIDYFLILSPGDLIMNTNNGPNLGTGTSTGIESDRDSTSLYKYPENASFNPKISSSYPAADGHSDMKIPDMTTAFAYPQGMSLSSTERAPYFFTFVFTDLAGRRLYGSILHFYELIDAEETLTLMTKGNSNGQSKVHNIVDTIKSTNWEVVYSPRAIVLISHYPFYNLFREFLGQIYHVSMSASPVPLERFVVNFMYETPLPPQGCIEVSLSVTGMKNRMLSLSRPMCNQLPIVDFSYRPLFGLLCIENIMIIFQSLLAERQICVFSDNIAVITPVLEAIHSLIFPFVWQGAYIPILPKNMAEFLEAPIPYTIGVHRSIVDSMEEDRRPEGVLFVDLDVDEVTVRLDGLRDVQMENGHGNGDSPSNANVNDSNYKLPSMPDKETAKLWQKLLEFGAHIHRTTETLTAVASASDLYPNNEYLIPIQSFPLEGSSSDVVNSNTKRNRRNFSLVLDDMQMEGRSGKQASRLDVPLVGSTSADREEKEEMKRIPITATRSNKPAASRPSILDSNNNIDTGDGFDAREIRAAFLRFFVALLRDYNHYTHERPVESDRETGETKRGTEEYNQYNIVEFDDSAFIEAHHEENAEFFKAMFETQMFQKFIQEKSNKPKPDDLRFFDESIQAKLNRHKFAKKLPTPFLSSKEWEVASCFTPPLPSTEGIPVGKRFVYSRFPDIKLKENVIGTIRHARQLVDSSHEHGRSNVRHSGDGASSTLIALTAAQTNLISPLKAKANNTGVTSDANGNRNFDFSVFEAFDDGKNARDIAPLLLHAKRVTERLHRGCECLGALYRMRKQRKWYLSQVKGYSRRQLNAKFYMPKQFAAVEIQRYGRAANARRYVSRIKRGVRVLQRFARRYFLNIFNDIRLSKNVSQILAHYRGYRARWECYEWRRNCVMTMKDLLYTCWSCVGTPLLVRSQVWTTIPAVHSLHPMALHLSLIETELTRVMTQLKIQHLLEGPPNARALLRVGPQVVMAVKATLAHREPSDETKQLLTLERKLLYEALKKRVNVNERDDLYRIFGLDQTYKRKQTLSKLLWLSPETADTSAAVIMEMLTAIHYPVGIFAMELDNGVKIDARHFVAAQQQPVIMNAIKAVAKGLLIKTERG